MVPKKKAMTSEKASFVKRRGHADAKEFAEVLIENLKVENSKAKTKNQLDDQKVIFKIGGRTYGEIEMRNDSEIHYREVKFWLERNLTFQLLKSKIRPNKKFNERIILYGKAIKKLKSVTNLKQKNNARGDF